MSNSKAFQNGAARASAHIANKAAQVGVKTENDLGSGRIKKGDTAIYKGREFDVIQATPYDLVLEEDGERLTVKRSECKPGVIK